MDDAFRKIADEMQRQWLERQEAYRRYESLVMYIGQAKEDIHRLRSEANMPGADVRNLYFRIKESKKSLARMEHEFEQVRQRLGFAPAPSEEPK